MTDQTAHPPGGTTTEDSAAANAGSAGATNAGAGQASATQASATQAGAAQAGAAKPGSAPPKRDGSHDSPPPRKRRSSSLMLALLLLVAAVFSIMLLSPDQWREIVAPSHTPSATIAVAPSPPPAPAPARPSASSAIPPAPAPSPAPSPAAGAINGELQSLRAALMDITGRLGELERKGADTRLSDLDNRLSRLDSRIAALIEQPVVTPGALTDALNENRHAAQAAAQEAAETAAQGAAQKAAQDAVQKAMAAQNMAPAVAELEKRLTALEKMAPAVVGIGDMERRLSSLEKMAPAVAAIADLERRLAGLEKTAVSATAVSDLDKRMAAMEKTTAPLTAMSQSALQGEALALGLLNLRLAFDRGGAYADVLSALRVAAAGDPVLTGEIDRLTPAAAVGAPTMAKLRQRLLAIPVLDDSKPAAAATPSAASETSAAPEGFWDGIWHRFASLVKVQRLDANAQTPEQSAGAAHFGAAIERASARLEADDLAGAIGLLDDEVLRRPLSAGQQSALDDWLREARARLTAETGFATLSRRSLALFSAKAEMPAAPAPRSDVVPSAPPAAPSAPAVIAPSAPLVDVPPVMPPQGAEVPPDDAPSDP